MGRRARKRRPSRVRKRPILLILALLCLVAVAGYLFDRPALLAGAGLLAGLILLIKVAHWQHRRRRRLAAARSLNALLALSPTGFEETMAELLRQLGYRHVRRIGGPGDRGVDIAGRDDKGHSVVVQCKRFAPRHHVGSPTIQSFIGMIVQHQAERGLFMTTSHFTRPAIALARDAPVPLILVDGPEIVRLAAAVKLRGSDAADLIEPPLDVADSRPPSPPMPSRRKRAWREPEAGGRAMPHQTCPHCGYRCQATDRFCGHCGNPLTPAGHAISPEIAGFTSGGIEDHPW